MEISGTARKIVDLISADNSIKIEALGKELNLSRAGVRYHLDILKQTGILKRIGGS